MLVWFFWTQGSNGLGMKVCLLFLMDGCWQADVAVWHCYYAPMYLVTLNCYQANTYLKI